MKKPDIGKRILPLLDIIFILLAFFIVLPHGIKSNEILEIDALNKRSESLQREVEYLKWKYGPVTASTKTHKKPPLTVVVRNNKVYFKNSPRDLDELDKMSAEDLKERLTKDRYILEYVALDDLKKKLEIKAVSFIIIQVDIDLSGRPETETATITRMEATLDELHITHVVYVVE